MPRIDVSTLMAVDVGIQVLGGIVCIAWVIHLVQSGAWRNPLAGVRAGTDGPGLLHLVAVVLAIALVPGVVIRLMLGMEPPPLGEPGEHSWHLRLAVANAVSLSIVGLLAWMLHGPAGFLPPSGPTGPTPLAGSPGEPFVASGAAAVPPFRPADPPPAPHAQGPGRLLWISLLAAIAAIPLAALQQLGGRIVWRLADPSAEAPLHPALKALEQSAWGEWGAVQVFASAVVIAPLYEELLFRGLVLSLLLRFMGRVWPAVILSGIAFGFIHFLQPQDVLPLCTLGVLLGYVRIRYNSLAACVLVHAIFNARTMILVLLNPEIAHVEF